MISKDLTSMTLTVPPISELTQTWELSLLEFREARALVDEDVVDDLVARGVDEVGHVGGLGGVDQHLPVRADAHALGLDAHRYFAQHRPRIPCRRS